MPNYYQQGFGQIPDLQEAQAIQANNNFIIDLDNIAAMKPKWTIKPKEQPNLKFTDLLYKQFLYHPMKQQNLKIQAAIDQNKEAKAAQLPMVLDTSVVGIEVEVEGVVASQQLENAIKPIWIMKDDGSLRNNGREFVSVPIQAVAAIPAIELLKQAIENNQNKYVFSDRTSIHIHLNMRRMTIEQTISFVLVYMMCEKMLFHFVDNCGITRSRNIFCTPLLDAGEFLPLYQVFRAIEDKKFNEVIPILVGNWSKYSSLNTIPLKELGTLEFRHMSGTLNSTILRTWLNLILSIKKYIHTHSYNHILKIVEHINTVSNYKEFLTDVFGEVAQDILRWYRPLDIEEGVIAIKKARLLAQDTEDKPVLEESVRNSSMVAFLKTAGIITLENKQLDELHKQAKTLKAQFDLTLDTISKLKFPKEIAKFQMKAVEIEKKLHQVYKMIEELR